MGTVKITSWTVEHLDYLVKDDISELARRRREAVIHEIRELSPDVLCILEGPEGEDSIDRVSNDLLEGEWVAVKAADGEYKIQGDPARVHRSPSPLGGGAHVRLAVPQPSDEQGLREAVRHQRGVRLRRHDPPNGEAVGHAR